MRPCTSRWRFSRTASAMMSRLSPSTQGGSCEQRAPDRALQLSAVPRLARAERAAVGLPARPRRPCTGRGAVRDPGRATPVEEPERLMPVRSPSYGTALTLGSRPGQGGPHLAARRGGQSLAVGGGSERWLPCISEHLCLDHAGTLGGSDTLRHLSLSVTMFTSCRRSVAKGAASSTVCLGSRGISLLAETPQILPSAVDLFSRPPCSREAFRGLQD